MTIPSLPWVAALACSSDLFYSTKYEKSVDQRAHPQTPKILQPASSRDARSKEKKAVWIKEHSWKVRAEK
jgi:hypothetical protein